MNGGVLSHPTRPRRRGARLTPMIDVVFLLLVFFLLAARFGVPGGLPLAAGGAGTGYEGPPRLVEIEPGAVRLNGRPMSDSALPEALSRLVADRGDVIVLRPGADADTQRLVAVMERLGAAGFTALVLVE